MPNAQILFRPQGAALPRYQNLLNMPSFDDSTPSVQKVPQSPTAQAVNQAEVPSDGMVAHAQYNSPLNVYSDDAVNETFAAQTGGEVNVTPQRQRLVFGSHITNTTVLFSHIIF